MRSSERRRAVKGAIKKGADEKTSIYTPIRAIIYGAIELRALAVAVPVLSA